VDGDSECTFDGSCESVVEGPVDGSADGIGGLLLGDKLAMAEGWLGGSELRLKEGNLLGCAEGVNDGKPETYLLGDTDGLLLGNALSFKLGIALGCSDGS